MPARALSKLKTAAAGFLLCALCVASVGAQQPAAKPGGEHHRSPADDAIAYREALYTLIGGNFKQIGGVLQGRAKFDDKILTRAERVAFLSTMVDEAFPPISQHGKTKAKPEVWSDPEGFSAAVKKFQTAASALVVELKKNNSDTPAFREAAADVGQACKNCHDKYRAK